MIGDDIVNFDGPLQAADGAEWMSFPPVAAGLPPIVRPFSFEDKPFQPS
jgi:hypothetical protein